MVSGVHKQLRPCSSQTLTDAVQRLLDEAMRQGRSLSDCLVLVPNDVAGAQFCAALAAVSGGEGLPRIKTFPALAQEVDVRVAVLPHGHRMLLLYQALRERGWFDEAQLWPLVTQLGALFDELTASALNLPQDVADFSAQLAQAYGMRESVATGFEARVVHALWYALSQPKMGLSSEAVYGLRLAQRAVRADEPLFLFGLWQIGVQEQRFLQHWTQRYPVVALDEGDVKDGLQASLQAAWEPLPLSALRSRAQQIQQQFPISPWSGYFHMLGCRDLEQEAQEAVRQIRHWQGQGLKNIAVLVQDRLTARRLRALLERQHTFPHDETGWSLDTTTAAAFVMRWLDAVEQGFPWQDTLALLQWCALLPLEDASWFDVARDSFRQFQQRHGATDGLARWSAAVAQDASDAPATVIALRLQRAVKHLSAQEMGLAKWLLALEASLRELGALDCWQQDAVGLQLFAALAEHRQTVATEPVLLGLTAFRRWMDHWLQGNYFVAAHTNTELIFTHLAAIQGRTFDAVLVLGGDVAQWAPSQPGGVFFNQAVRAALGLPGWAEVQQQVRRELTCLLATGVTCCVLWQAQRDGEPNPLASWFQRLDMLHQLAWGSSLCDSSFGDRSVGVFGQPLEPVMQPCPPVPECAVPARISVSGYNSLLACPYQYYARSVLHIGQVEPIQDEMVKSDYGQLVHEILRRFHLACPQVADLLMEQAEHQLRQISEQCYGEWGTQDVLSRAWLMRWQGRIPDYLAWQRQHEAKGWVWHSGEQPVQYLLQLGPSQELQLQGRIDRIDARQEDRAVLDYKTGNVQGLKQAVINVDEDVQLPAYAAMLAPSVHMAAFVSLDGESVESVELDDSALQQAAECSMTRLRRIFSGLLGGAGMPANGRASTCAWCEAQGVCRRDEWGP